MVSELVCRKCFCHVVFLRREKMNEMPSAIVHGWWKLVATLYVPKDSTMPVSCSSGFGSCVQILLSVVDCYSYHLITQMHGLCNQLLLLFRLYMSTALHILMQEMKRVAISKKENKIYSRPNKIARIDSHSTLCTYIFHLYIFGLPQKDNI